MNFNAPQGIAQSVIEKVGVGKCKLSFWQMLVLGILAGAFIAFGAQLATRIMANVVDPGLQMVLGGAVFSVGLMLVVIAGAELFTGNNLIFMSVLAGETTIGKMLTNWVVVWIANFIGSLLIAWLMIQSGLVSGVIADKAIAIAAGKTGASFWQIFVRGIMCNWLVCLAVWLALAAHDIPGKILGIFMPIMAFVASGFEHSVANMYFIPMGMMLDKNITQNGLWGNLAASTLGNIVGGAFFVATLYWFVYHKCNKK